MANTYKGEAANHEFLTDFVSKESNKYKSASFLRSDFYENTWRLEFQKESLTVDFNIPLSANTVLTDDSNSNLLMIFKTWICSADRFSKDRGVYAGETTKHRKVIRILSILDYMLLRNEQLLLEEHALALFNRNEYALFLKSISRSSEKSLAFYNWDIKLYDYLITLANSIPPETIQQVINETPILSLNQSPLTEQECANEIDSIFNDKLGGNVENLLIIRAALWHSGMYKQCSMAEWKYVPHVRKITEKIYPNTLRGKTHHKIPSALKLLPKWRRNTEYPIVPVRQKHRKMDERSFSSYIHELRDLNRLGRELPGMPLEAIPEDNDDDAYAHCDLTSTGRYKTAPVTVVLSALRSAIEFYLAYGDAITDTFLEFAKAAKASALTFQQFGSTNEASILLKKLPPALGITRWATSLSERKSKLVTSKADFYSAFRASPGLWDILRILYGAIQLTIGTLQARRESELRKLIANDCLVEEGMALRTVNRKSGYMDMNESIIRPTPDIARRMITTIENMQCGLIEAGLLDNWRALFSYPSINGKLQSISHTSYNNSLNFFCDYTETDLDMLGRRYYLRQHQLRRFFAQIFFWSQTNDELDVLRWVLGHTDPEMVYHYITETTPGSILRELKAGWGTDSIRASDGQTENLALYLRTHYGVTDFSLLNDETIDGYIEFSLKHGDIDIEPHFFTNGSTVSYRIIVIVREK